MQNNTDVNLDDRLGIVAVVPQWCRSFQIIFIAIVFFTGLPGNALVILIQVKNKKKSSTDWLVTYMAVSDVLSVIVNIPVYTLILAQWWPIIGSTFGCRLHRFVIHLTAVAPNIIIACIAVDRFWKSKSVHQPFTPKRAFYSGIVAFGFSMIFGAITAFTSTNNAVGMCVNDKSKDRLRAIVYYVMIAVGIICTCITIYSYVRIVKSLRNRQRLIQSCAVGHYGKALRTTKLMFLVTFVFIVSTLISPIAVIVQAVTSDGTSSTPLIVVFLLKKIYLINSCTNPFFYFWLNTAFRKKAISIFKDSCFSR